MRRYEEENFNEEYERGYRAGRREALRESESSNESKFKRLGFEYNSRNNTYDWEEGSVVFGVNEDGELDYFRISDFSDDYNPDMTSIKSEINSRIKDLQSALKVLGKL